MSAITLAYAVYAKRLRACETINSGYKWWYEPTEDLKPHMPWLRAMQVQWASGSACDSVAPCWIVRNVPGGYVVVFCTDSGRDVEGRPHTLREEVFFFPEQLYRRVMGRWVAMPESVEIEDLRNGQASLTFPDGAEVRLGDGVRRDDFTLFGNAEGILFAPPQCKQNGSAVPGALANKSCVAPRPSRRIDANETAVRTPKRGRNMRLLLQKTVLLLLTAGTLFGWAGVWFLNERLKTSERSATQAGLRMEGLEEEYAQLRSDHDAEIARYEASCGKLEAERQRLQEDCARLSDDVARLRRQVASVELAAKSDDESRFRLYQDVLEKAEMLRNQVLKMKAVVQQEVVRLNEALGRFSEANICLSESLDEPEAEDLSEPESDVEDADTRASPASQEPPQKSRKFILF